MKKTNSMRVAVAMLALTLITSCFVGGTFAKYTTSENGGDSARVAKFGVNIDAGKSTFLDEYEANDETYNGKYSVASSDGKKVVAPGTSGEIDLFSISGTPEVAVRINAEMSKIQSIYMKIKSVITFEVDIEAWKEEKHSLSYNPATGGWDDVVAPIPEDQAELEKIYNDYANDSWIADQNPITKTEVPGVEYYPIKWTLEKDGTAVVTDDTLEAVKDYIDANINGKEYGPNTDLADKIGGAYKLKWEWKFESGNGDNNVVYDAYDTLLGDIAAGTKENNAEINLNEAFNFSITVTQID